MSKTGQGHISSDKSEWVLAWSLVYLPWGMFHYTLASKHLSRKHGKVWWRWIFIISETSPSPIRDHHDLPAAAGEYWVTATHSPATSKWGWAANELAETPCLHQSRKRQPSKPPRHYFSPVAILHVHTLSGTGCHVETWLLTQHKMKPHVMYTKQPPQGLEFSVFILDLTAHLLKDP